MATQDVLMLIAFGFIIWAIVALIMIVARVSRSGTKVNFLLITILFFRYISVYEELTKKETGKTGPLVYHFIIPWWIALILVVIWIILTMTA